MLDPSLLRNEPDAVAGKLARQDFKLGTDKLSALEECRKVLQVKTENLRAEHNPQSKFINQAKARGEDIEPLRLEANKLGEELDTTKTELDALQAGIRDIALTIPSLPADGVPASKDGNDNVEVGRWGTPHESDFEVRDHVALGEMHSGLDFATTVKLTGPRFVVMKGQIARMHRALSQFMLDLHTEQHGYSKNHVPYLVNQDTLCGTGQLSKFAGDLSYTRPLEEGADTSNYALTPATEVPLTDLVRGKIIDEDDLPVKMTARALCFHSGAGSYGRDTRGLVRMHQFDRVEMVQIMRPENSMVTLEEMTGHTEKVPQLPGLPCRKIILYTGDMGFGTCKTYDLEVWTPAQNTYRKVSSYSNVWDFQARRMQTCCRSKLNKKTRLIHTLNGSDLAVGRMLAAVMKNYQQANGRIEVLEILHPYMNGLEYIG